MRLPNQRQLKFFAILAKTRNFSRAAKDCNVSQPSFSNGIKDLEKILDCRLFERNTRTVKITQIGAKLLPVAEASLARWEHGITDLVRIAEDKSTIIRIAAVTSLTDYVLPNALSLFKQVHPDVYVDINDVMSPEVEEAVDSGVCDIGICLAPIDDKKFESFQVTSDNLYVFCHKSHPLARHPQLSWRDVFDYPIVSFADPSWIFRNIQMVYEQHALKYNPVSTLRYQSSLIGMLANGEYFTILPSLMAKQDGPNNIVVIPLENPIITRHYVMIRSKLGNHLPGHQNLFDFLASELDRLSQIKKDMLRK